MALLRLSNARQPMATGIIAPMVRVATHLGYCTNVAGEDHGNEWEDEWNDIKADLLEAHAHMDSPPDMTPFIPQTLIDQFQVIKDQMTELRESTPTKEEAFANLQTLTHNVAYVAARFEHYTTGEDVTEGSQA